MRTVPLRRLLASVDNGAWGDDPGESDVDVQCVRAADFDFDALRVDLGGAPVRGVDQRTWSRLRLRRGDLVLEKSGGGELAPVGRVVQYQDDSPAITSNFAARVVPQPWVDSRFLVYSLRSLYHRGVTLQCIKQTTGIQNLDTGHWLKSEIFAPQTEEQRRIAEFLDDRVARIDRIIEARRQQTRHTQETLDAAWAQQSDSHERSFGLVPLRRFLVSIADGPFGSSLTSSHYADSGTRVIRLGNIGIAAFRGGDEAFVSSTYGDKLSAHAVRQGDLIMAGLGDDRWPLGRCAVVPANVAPAIVKADCYRIRLDSRIRHDYAAMFLSSPPARQRAMLLGRGATRARLNTDVARASQLPPATAQAQQEYVAAINSRQDTLLQSVAVLVRSIALLTEYKLSLITAAVTGGLDVTTAGSGVPG